MHVAKNSGSEAFVRCALRSQNWLAKEAAFAVVKNLVFFVGACKLLRTSYTRFLSLLGSMSSDPHPLCTPRASPFVHERLLWCIMGSNSA